LGVPKKGIERWSIFIATKSKLSQGALDCLALVRDGFKTVADMKEDGHAVNSAYLTALVNRELVSAKQVTLECACCGHKRKVNSYELTEKGVNYKGE
jgi:hypothetical protein